MINKKLAAGIASAATLVSMTAPLAMAATTTSASYHPQVKSIYMNSQLMNRPYGIVANNTMYMPIWYVMQALTKLGIQNSWDGTDWTLTAPATLSVDLSNIPSTHGSSGITLNGTDIYHVDSIAYTDPSTNVKTTFMPIWYTQQLLNRLGIHSTWDGFAWQLTSAASVADVNDTTQSAVNYTVKFGDSLWGISQKYGVPISAITSQNGITDANSLVAGQILAIPQATPSSTATTTPATQTTTATTTTAATVISRAGLVNQIVATAKSYRGAHRYVWGGTSPSGWDCSGYTSYVFTKSDVTIPRVSRDEFKVGMPIAKSGLQPGDLVFFGGTTTATARTKAVSHVGIYVGSGNFIQESSSQNAVVITSLNNVYWAAHYVGAKRIL